MSIRKLDFVEMVNAAGIEPDGPVEKLLLQEYGAVFAAQDVKLPPFIVFPNGASVTTFQAGVAKITARVGDHEFTLQAAAMSALLGAVDDARKSGLSITPRGPDSGDRTYAGTVELWASRVDPALDHWQALGRITTQAVERMRNSSPFEQVSLVLELEADGIFFAKDLSKSIIYSVAPPGSSQHLTLLAFDVTEFDQPAVRKILGRYGWHQTVTSDLPHFTYLGVDASELPRLGLKCVVNADREFWLPDI